MQYNNNIVTRATAPTHAGVLDENDPSVGVGLVGSPACGDVLRFMIKIEDGKVVQAKFQTFGCGSAIASSDLLAEKVLGRTLAGAEAVTNLEIYEELALPPVKLHCSVLAEDAIHAALNNWRSKNQVEPKQAL